MTCQFNVAVRLYQRLKLELLHPVQYPRYCTGSQSQIHFISILGSVLLPSEEVCVSFVLSITNLSSCCFIFIWLKQLSFNCSIIMLGINRRSYYIPSLYIYIYIYIFLSINSSMIRFIVNFTYDIYIYMYIMP